MILENDVLNEQQLCAAGFTHFFLFLARLRLAETKTDGRADRDILKLIIWLLCLTLSQQVILYMSNLFIHIYEQAGEIHSMTLSFAPVHPLRVADDDQGIPGKPQGGGDSCHVMTLYTYLRRQLPLVPEPAFAAIHLTFRLLETNRVRIPAYLPETRAIANPTLRSGPIRDYYRTMASYQTTFPVTISAHGTPDPPCPPHSFSMESDHSTNNDMFFDAILRSLRDQTCSETFGYISGTITGLWEGILDVPITNVDFPAHRNSTLFSMALIMPMQCAVVEYICSHFGNQSSRLYCDILGASDVCPPNLFSEVRSNKNNCQVILRCLQHIIKHDIEVVFDGRRYKKHNLQTVTMQKIESHAQEAQQFYDDKAWGGFKFSGRVMDGGRILLKREPKYTDGERGLWIFEGQLRSDTLILGRWQVAGNPSAVDQGIFSMGKARGR
ncbi:hypothetical protein CVT25_003624 [Psilocybe cyanescens]|uniref:Uncharacterized protein n=1 Tax=Psilocybe cyanescens TaxID=93625 RepID=A0A409WPC8_PSICY|nr:hypothetical protein CVT25_003624 [Psilocybe cyanescens]